MLKISNKISDQERAYINNLIISGTGEVRNTEGKFNNNPTHELIEEKGFIVEARKIIKRNA